MSSKKHLWDTKEKVHAEAKKYFRKIDFRKQSSGAYKAAKIKGWFESVTCHMEKPLWDTKDKVHTEALKYQRRIDFTQQSGGAYRAARRLNILDLVCSHMEGPLYDTEEKIQREADKYKTRTEFRKGSSAAYKQAVNKKILDKVCKHMLTFRRSYTLKELREIAQRYIRITEFLKHDAGAYHAARRSGHFEDITSHIVRAGPRPNTYTKGYVLILALLCETLKQFRETYPNAYGSALKKIWFDDVTQHLRRDKKPKGSYSKEKCLLEARQYKTKKAFKERSPQVYSAVRYYGWYDEATEHMSIPDGYSFAAYCSYVIYSDMTKQAYIGVTTNYNKRMSSHKNIEKTCRSRLIMENSKSKPIFQKLTPYEYHGEDVERIESWCLNNFRELGYHIVNDIKKSGSLGTPIAKIWTEKTILCTALLYETYKLFREQNQGAYTSLLRRHRHMKEHILQIYKI